MRKKFNVKLIAPCGMNCGVCVAHLREKNKCEGCNSKNCSRESCKKCSIKNCEELKKLKKKFCSEKCKKFPCRKLKQGDERYRKNYGMSMIENLKEIDKKGIKTFLKNQEKKYISKEGIICVHNKKVYN